MRVRKAGRVYEYHYHRATRTRLKSEPGTLAFATEVERLNNQAQADFPGTLYSMISAFKASPEWAGLADRTRKDYAQVLDYLAPLGGDDPSAYTPSDCLEVRDAAFKSRGYRFSKYVIQVCSRLWNWGLPREYVSVNPWASITAIKRPKELGTANPPWTAQELATGLMTAPIGLARGLALCAMGRDGSDAIRTTWGEIEGGEKARGKTGGSGRLIIPDALAPIFQGERFCEFVTTHSGNGPWKTQNTFTKARRDHMEGLAARGLVRHGLTTHGLRKTLATIITEGGGELRTVQNALQHKTVAMALHYSAEADMTKRSGEAMKLLSGALSDAGFGKPFGKPGTNDRGEKPKGPAKPTG